MKRKVTDIGRRNFLKAAGGIAAACGVSVTPVKAQAASKGRLATLIDVSLCDGCPDREMPACISSCKTINKDIVPDPVDPIPEPWPRKTIEDWSKRKEVFNRLTPYNYIYVQKAAVDVGGRKTILNIPRRCMHCDNPACATICPFSANHKMKSGAVVIDQDICFGGAKCRSVCPWGIPQRQSGVGVYLNVLPGYMGNGVMYKCDLCHNRLAEGKLPGCVEECPKKALLIGPREDIYAVAEERANAINGFIYGKMENGGTATLYVSPVSFDDINKALQKKPGEPDMKPNIGRRFAKTDVLGKAVLAAPAIGIAAGAAGAFKWLAARKDKIEGGDERND